MATKGNVVRIKREPIRHPETIDLRGNNRFHDLLETYVEETNRLYDAKRKKAKVYYEIMEMIGNAEEAEADQFYVWLTTVNKPERVVPEHVVEASSYRLLRVRRKGR